MADNNFTDATLSPSPPVKNDDVERGLTSIRHHGESATQAEGGAHEYIASRPQVAGVPFPEDDVPLGLNYASRFKFSKFEWPKFQLPKFQLPSFKLSKCKLSKSNGRWMRFLLLGIVILLLLPVQYFGFRDVTRIIVRFFKHLSRKHQQDPNFGRIDTINNCVNYADWQIGVDTQNHTYRSTAFFEFPLSTDELYFQSHMSPEFANGEIEFTNSGDLGDNTITVELIASYRDPEFFHLTQTCWLQPRRSSYGRSLNGIGIFGPTHDFIPTPHPVHYTIKVHFPNAHPTRGPYTIQSLHTNLNKFAHRVGDLQDTVEFKTFSLTGKGAPISVDSLSSQWATFFTDNSGFSGKFQISGGLNVFAGNSPIDVDVMLVNSAFMSPFTVPASVQLENQQHEINADMTLFHSTVKGRLDKSGGSFRVDVRGSDGPINITFPSAPLDSQLRLQASTSNAPVFARLNETFEGRVSLSQTSSTPYPPSVVDSGAEDPGNTGRQRVIDVVSSGNALSHLSGMVTWWPNRAPSKQWQSNAQLTTRGSFIELVV